MSEPFSTKRVAQIALAGMVVLTLLQLPPVVDPMAREGREEAASRGSGGGVAVPVAGSLEVIAGAREVVVEPEVADRARGTVSAGSPPAP